MDTQLANSLPEFGKRMGGLGKSFLYEEVKKGRLKLVKAGARSLVTEKNGRAYIKLLEDEAEAADARAS